jgi:hypothetical protein
MVSRAPRAGRCQLGSVISAPLRATGARKSKLANGAACVGQRSGRGFHHLRQSRCRPSGRTVRKPPPRGSTRQTRRMCYLSARRCVSSCGRHPRRPHLDRLGGNPGRQGAAVFQSGFGRFVQPINQRRPETASDRRRSSSRIFSVYTFGGS